MTIQELYERLNERIVEANQDAKESHKMAMNSYGAGYDCGWRDALNVVLNTINGEEDNVL